LGNSAYKGDTTWLDELACGVSQLTIADYDRLALQFWEGTRDHDVSQNYLAFLNAVNTIPPYCILDIGCGPGRDLHYFRSLGHDAIGLDGSRAFVDMAREFSGCVVLHQDFLAMELPVKKFDGIFANAALFHVPSAELPRVLQELNESLKDQGVLFSSNPRGNNEEGLYGNRYNCFHELEAWREFVTQAGFVELHHYYRPEGQPREKQTWLASVWRKV
tara:strand:+ start:1167 stop:1820 length:654 start_codon:yes stop_codon:yes gene_type:complete